MLVLSFHFFLYGKFTNISDKKKIGGYMQGIPQQQGTG